MDWVKRLTGFREMGCADTRNRLDPRRKAWLAEHGIDIEGV